MAERELAIIIRAKDLASKAIKNTSGNLKDLNSVAGRTGKGIGTSILNVAKLGAVAGGAAVGGIALAVHAAADFESQLNTINTVAHQTPVELKATGDTLRKMARESGQDIADLTGAYYDLVSAGIKPGADATNVLKNATTLAIGGLATTGETVDLLTTALNSYHAKASQATHITDVFAGAIAAGKTTAADLAASFAQVAPLASSAGIEIEELGAAYGTMTAAGVKTAQVTTNIRAAIVAVQRPSVALKKIAKDMGVDFAKMAREKGLAYTMDQIRKAAAKAKVPLIQVLGSVEAQGFALGVTGDAAKTYAKNLSDAQKQTGTAAEQAAERQKGMNFQLDRLKALAKDAGITIGSKLLPKLTPLAEKAVQFLDAHQPDIEKFGDEIAGAFDKAAAFANRIPWEAVGSGLKSAASWAGKLMDVFLALPPGVQTTIIALAGLNKLSGGAITGIAGELGKGLIKGVLGMNAGVVNINAAAVNGGGLGAAAGAAGGIGAGTVLAGAALTAAAVAAVAAVAIDQSNKNSATATGVRTTADVYLQQSPPLADLQRSLAAVDTGIAQIQSNPLNVLVAGDALDQLRGTKAAIEDQIRVASDSTVRTVAATERAEASMTSKQLATAAATRDVRSAIEANRIAQQSGFASARAAVDATTRSVQAVRTATTAAGATAKAGGIAAANAINRKKLAFHQTTVIPVTLNTRVSSLETSKVQTTQKRAYSTLL